MSNKYEEIQNRLNIIQVLEGIQFRVDPMSNETYETVAYKIRVDIPSLLLSKAEVPYTQYRNEKAYGELSVAIDVINKTIKETFAPLIASQREAIKKLI